MEILYKYKKSSKQRKIQKRHPVLAMVLLPSILKHMTQSKNERNRCLIIIRNPNMPILPYQSVIHSVNHSINQAASIACLSGRFSCASSCSAGRSETGS